MPFTYRKPEIRILLHHLWVLAFIFAFFQPLQANGNHRTHPFALATQPDINEAIKRLDREPYRAMLKDMIEHEKTMATEPADIYELAGMVRLQASLFALTKDEEMAEKCYETMHLMISDTLFVKNPYSFGLTRAIALRDMALSYDLCYNAWSETQRITAFNSIFSLMQSVNLTMGIQGNYRLESNWMGVRYGSVLLAAVVLNDSLSETLGKNEMVRAHLWDSKERIRDHVHASHTSSGWFVETMGYQLYDGQFVWPAIIAFQNMHNPGVLTIEKYVPRISGSFRQHITGSVSIPTVKRIGVKPDLANDNPFTYISQWPLWLRLLDKDSHPSLNWMMRYMYQPGLAIPVNDLFYAILFYDANDAYHNPATDGLLTYFEPENGAAIFRNSFSDSTDIIATFNTSAKRFGGHAGPDNLSFRIYGLGNIWAVGTGRTGSPVGQTAFFPAEIPEEPDRPLPESEILAYEANSSDGSGYIIGHGSCMGVENHTRLFMAEYAPETGAEALFVIKDTSDNGRIWRMHTPEFNKVEIVQDGVLITAPNGSTMKIVTPGIDKPEINIGTVRYGGTTIRNNPGVGYNGQNYFNNQLVDIMCNKNITVVITLQQPGAQHPEISLSQNGIDLQAGGQLIHLPKY